MGYRYESVRNPDGTAWEQKIPICSTCGSEDCETRYSLGIYAGICCDGCWDRSGYRKEGREGFDPMDAGEAYEPEDY